MTLEARITILGSSAATPTKERFHSGQYLFKNGTCILIDCGEGTQNRMLQYGLSLQKIDYVFISHLHGDHYLGLPGLLNSMGLNHRAKKLTIFCPEGLKQLLDLHFELGKTQLGFELEIIEHKAFARVDVGAFECDLIPVVHRIPCFGFVFREKSKKRKLNVSLCQQLEIPQEAYRSIQNGEDFRKEDGSVIPNQNLTFNPQPTFSYGYLTDSLFVPELAQYFQSITVLYHEATYLNDLMDRARQTFHSTAQQAATFAANCGANQLIIGHFSARYDELETHLSEAKSIFPNSFLAEEGKTFVLS